MTRRRRSSATDDARFYFDEAAADRATTFFEDYCCFDNEMPFILQPWQREFVRNLFGWKRRADSCRKYRIVFMSMGKGNGKTPLLAGVGAYLIFTVTGALVFSAGADREQASLCLTDAKKFVNVSEYLRSRAEILQGSIVVPTMGSAWRSLSSQAKSKHGIRPLAVLFDELHTQSSRELWDTLYTGRLKNPNSLIFAATTAGFDRKSICYEVYDRARKVRDGIIDDPEFLPLICEPSEGSDWREPKTWAMANPNLGVTVRQEDLAKEAENAKEQPAVQNRFRRMHLNEWTEQATRAIDMKAWQRCAGKVNIAELTGQDCFAAIDLSTKLDVTALVLLFPRPNGEYHVLPFFWIPEENMPARIRRDGVPFDAWVRDGYVQATPGNMIDYGFIRKHVRELRECFKIREVAFDPWNAAKISVDLIDDGFKVIEFPQRPSTMNEPIQTMLAMIGANPPRMRHGGNPVLTWMASNLAIRVNAEGMMRPSKHQDDSPDRIDGMVCLVMALGRAEGTAKAPEPRIWSFA